MWLKSLRVTNFRGFEKLDVTFDEHVTLLVGGNGAGKTAVLDAIATGLGPFWGSLTDRPPTTIPDGDVRHVFRELNGIPDVQILWPVDVALGAYSPQSPGRPLTLYLQHGRLSRSSAFPPTHDNGVSEYLRHLKSTIRDGRPGILPLLANYGVGRSRSSRAPETRPAHGPPSRTDGYDNALSADASEGRLISWMRQRTAEEVQQQQSNREYRHSQLRAVASAVEDCIDGVVGLVFNLMRDEIQLRVGDRVLALSMLSAGYRNMIAMVADIARRAAVLNPQCGANAARETIGVVLIDEIELHLHPKWQRSVIPSLRRTFPKMQFIATTHSPQVLASVQRDQVRIFDSNRLVDAAPFVEGRASNELLTDVFDVPARPEATERELDELFHLLDTEDYVAAQAKFSALVGRLGPDDAAMVRARWILDTEGGVKHVAPIAS